jgi:hypothetical protein
MKTIEVNPAVLAMGNAVRCRWIRREIRRLEAELRSLEPKLADVLDARD